MGIEIEEKATVESTVEVPVEAPVTKPVVLTRRPSAPTPATTLQTAKVGKLTVTAPKAAKRLEPHFKGYAAGKKITVAINDEDTLVLTGDDVTADTKTYVLRYSDVTNAE